MEQTEERFNVKEVYDMYTENDKLDEGNIFHIFDSGIECKPENVGYHDSRLCHIVVFNTNTMEKWTIMNRDGINSLFSGLELIKARVYADGSFFIQLNRCAKIDIFQSLQLN